MSFTVQITLGLVLILATCGYLEGASFKRHIRQTPEVPEYGTKLAQKNLTLPSDQKLAEQTVPPGKGLEQPQKKDVLWKTTPAPKSQQLVQKKPINLGSSQSENDETYEDDSHEKNLQRIAGKSYDVASTSSLSSASVEESPKKISNKLPLEKENVKKEEALTSKPDKSRAIPFDIRHEDINKYTSEDFHNKNNVYNQQTSPDIAKYVNLGAENDTKTAYTQQLTSTPEYDYNYSEYAEVTTPKTEYFDTKFKAITDGVKQNLEYHDRSVEKPETVEKGDEEDDIEDFKFDESKLIDAANKDNKTTLDYHKYKTISINNANKPNGLRKNITSENGTSIDFRTSFLKSDVIDQKSNDYSNQIPNTNADQVSSGSEYKESVNQVKVDETAKLEKPAILLHLAKNKTALIQSLKDSSGARRLSNLRPPISSEEEISSIDPLTTENVSEISINVYKRGSTKAVAPKDETTTATSIENNINFDNKSFSIPPTGTAWTLAGLRDVPVASTTEQVRPHLKNNTAKEADSPKVAHSNNRTEVPNQSHSLISTNTTKNATKAVAEKSAPIKLIPEEIIATTTTSTTPKSFVTTAKSVENVRENENSVLSTVLPDVSATKKFKTELLTNKTKNISDVDMSYEDSSGQSKEGSRNGVHLAADVTTTTEASTESTSTETDTQLRKNNQNANLKSLESTSSKAYEDLDVLPTAETSADYSKLNEEEKSREVVNISTVKYAPSEASLEEVTITSSTEQYTTTTLDYEDMSTTLVAEQNDTSAPYYSTTGTEYEQIGSTTDASSESTTNFIPGFTTTAIAEEDAFTTIVPTDGSTENVAETDAAVTDKNHEKGTEKGPVINFTVVTTPATMITGHATSAKPVNVTSSTNGLDNVDMDEENDEHEEDLGEDEHKSQPGAGAHNTTVEPAGGGDPEIEIIPYQPVDGEHPTQVPETKHGYQPPIAPVEPKVNATEAKNGTQTVKEVSVKTTSVPEGKLETTTVDSTSTDSDPQTANPDEDNSGTIAAIVISCIGAVCLVVLAILLIIMRKRQKRFNHLQRCTPINLDDYSLDNVSVYNSVSARRKGVCRGSKRSYGNPAFDDPVSVTRPLTFPGLAKFAENQEQIHAEFEEIPQVTARTNELPEGCETKNRYANVIPLPETRVFLNTIESEPNSDYINANYVTGPQNARGYYIACQAPMTETVDDFWRMIWEQQTKVVLMLTNLYENGVEKCADYLPPSEVLDCHRLFGDYQVTLKKREVKEKYIISSLQLKNMVSNSWREVTHLWYLGWPDRGVPSEANSIIAFLIEARSFLKFNVLDIHRAITKPTPASADGSTTTNGNAGLASNRRIPVVIHCSPGTGRTGTVIACDIAIRDFEQTRQVDIPRTVYRIRRDRASAVQTKEQYAFIYMVLNLYATKLTGNALESP